MPIDGPTAVNLNDACTWWASANGGSPPYSFSWSGIANGTGSSVSASSSSFSPCGMLYLNVTDAVGGTGSTSISVSVDSSNQQPLCFS